MKRFVPTVCCLLIWLPRAEAQLCGGGETSFVFLSAVHVGK